MTGAKLGHILRINLLHLKKASYFLQVSNKKNIYFFKFPIFNYTFFTLQEAIPTRLVGLHFLNATSLMDRFLAVIQPFLKKELLDMLHVHTTMDTFYKFVPREIVPKDFGGPGLEMKELEGKFCFFFSNFKLILKYIFVFRYRKLLPIFARIPF